MNYILDFFRFLFPIQTLPIETLPIETPANNNKSICIECCDTLLIPKDIKLPNELERLEIKYCNLEEFEVDHLPDTLVYINLSFNRLKRIPTCIYEFYISHPNIVVNLKNNDIWYMEYSNLSPGLTTPDVVDELMKAHRMNIISTMSIHTAINTLRFKNHHAAADRLSILIGIQIEVKATDEKTSYENPQNVHIHSVGESVRNSIKHLKTLIESNHYQQDWSDQNSNKFEDVFISNVFHNCTKNNIKNVKSKLRKHLVCQIDGSERFNYSDIAKIVYLIAVHHEHKNEIFSILQSEIIDGIDMCFTGRISRLVNALNGFIDGINVGIGRNEEISNSLLVLRRKNVGLYGNDYVKYYEETIPQAIQLMEDICMPESEQLAWIEYI